MIPKIKLLAAIAVLLTAFASAPSASAAYVVNFRGKIAYAYFNNTSGCFGSEIYIFPVEEVLIEPPFYSSDWSYVDMLVFHWNGCTGEELIAASGLTQIPSSEFQVANSLSSATLNTTAMLFNIVTSENIELDVNLNWTATSPRHSLNINNMFNLPDCRIVSRYRDTFRLATASGSITYNGTDLTLGPPDPVAEIGSTQTGRVFIGCG
jgi:hypothetical protein